ncbi:MAG: hypothetical protein IKU37_06060 [Candidatus Gastranaerophilales bacterium]|nr:hypothetical protein [Candidatus Gastranaerophilales bacterium]
MKITSIKTPIVAKQKISNLKSVKQNLQTDAISISFGAKRVKHSDEFLKITKNDKDLRGFITKTCMLSDDEEFLPDREKFYCKAYGDFKTEDTDVRIVLIACAAAINGAKNAKLKYCFNSAKKLLNAGFSKEDIVCIFNSDLFKVGYVDALLYLKGIQGDDFDLSEADVFIANFCKDDNDIIAPERVTGLTLLFEILSIDNKYQADVLYDLCCNDGEFSLQRAQSLFSLMVALIEACKQVGDDPSLYFNANSEKAKGDIISMFSSLFLSSTLENGEIDIDKTVDILEQMAVYAHENREELNASLKIPFFDVQSGGVIEMTVDEIKKVNPALAEVYDNLFFRTVVLFNNEASTIPQ